MKDPDEFQTLEEVDQAIASLRKRRALLFVLEGQEQRNWAVEEVHHLLESLDYEQLVMLRGVLLMMLGPGIDASMFSIKTDWDLTKRAPSELFTRSTDR